MKLMFFPVPTLSPSRVRMAYAAAAITDILQLLLGPLGWFAVDQGLDVAAMCATSALIGFHPLLLPTFVIELFPVADLLPTWTGCVAIVVMLRKKHQAAPPPPDGQIIDV